MITQIPLPPQLHAVKNGYILLLSVLFVGAIATSIVVTLLTVNVGSVQSTQVAEQSMRAQMYADACVEEALYQLQQDSAYTGNTTLEFEGGECAVVSVLGTGDVDRTIQIESAVSEVVYRLEVNVSSIVPPAAISSWRRVSAF